VQGDQSVGRFIPAVAFGISIFTRANISLVEDGR